MVLLEIQSHLIVASLATWTKKVAILFVEILMQISSVKRGVMTY